MSNYNLRNRQASSSAMPASLREDEVQPRYPHTCERCGNTYRTEQGKLQHQRRYCRGPSADVDNTCSTCSRQFTTFAGLRQHIRRAHTAIYNAELQVESTSSRRLWSEDEQNQLAKAEAQLDSRDPTAIIDHLATLSTRTREAIKRRRQRPSFGERVHRFRQTLAVVNAESEESGQSEYESATEEADQNNNTPDAVLIDHLSSIEVEDAHDTALRRSVLSASMSSRDALDQWTRHLVETYGRANTQQHQQPSTSTRQPEEL